MDEIVFERDTNNLFDHLILFKILIIRTLGEFFGFKGSNFFLCIDSHKIVPEFVGDVAIATGAAATASSDAD